MKLFDTLVLSFKGWLKTPVVFVVRPHDPVTFIVVPGVLFIAALLACYISARKAAHTDPITALRRE